MNRTEVMERLQPALGMQSRLVNQGQARVTVGADRLEFHVGHGHPYPIRDEGLKALLERASVSTALAERLTPRTLALACTESLAERPHTLMMREGGVAGITQPGNFQPLPPERVLDTIERVVGDGVSYNRALVLSPHQIQVETVGVEERPVVRGDMVRAGVMVRFSPTGVMAPEVQSFVVRLACTNGATTMDVFQRFEGGGHGEGDSAWQWFRESVRHALGSLGRVVTRWQELRGQNIPDAERAFILAEMLHHAGIKGPDAEAVRAEALRAPPRNRYDMLQLITWASSHVLTRPQAILRAQATAAEFGHDTEQHGLCPTCRRIR